MKAYGVLDPLILNFGTIRRWVIRFTLRPIFHWGSASGTHCRRQGESLSWPRCGSEEKYSYLCSSRSESHFSGLPVSHCVDTAMSAHDAHVYSAEVHFPVRSYNIKNQYVSQVWCNVVRKYETTENTNILLNHLNIKTLYFVHRIYLYILHNFQIKQRLIL
jgi:hypothetical protein